MAVRPFLTKVNAGTVKTTAGIGYQGNASISILPLHLVCSVNSLTAQTNRLSSRYPSL